MRFEFARSRPWRIWKSRFAFPSCATKAVPPLISKCWMAKGPFLPQNSRWRRREATNIRVSCNFTGRLAVVGRHRSGIRARVAEDLRARTVLEIVVFATFSALSVIAVPGDGQRRDCHLH